jgi:hypothetical protein
LAKNSIELVYVDNLGLVPVNDDISEAKELRVPLEPEATYLNTLFIIFVLNYYIILLLFNF